MNSWAPLWSGIVDSSIWDEPDYVVKVFLTMMALKDSDHIVRLTAYQISKRAKKDELEVLDALKILNKIRAGICTRVDVVAASSPHEAGSRRRGNGKRVTLIELTYCACHNRKWLVVSDCPLIHEFETRL